MRTAIRSKVLAGSAAALLILGTAACTNDPEPDPTPSIEAAPTDDTSDGGGTEADPSQSSDPTEASGECEVKEGEEALPTEAPPVDGWQDVNGLSVPVSAELGPYIQDGDLWKCYEHSPSGAALAAHYAFPATGSVKGFADEWAPEGSYQDQLREAEKEQSTPSEETATPAGFRVTSYSADKAVVDVAIEVANSQGTAITSMRWTLLWDGNKWQIDPEAAQSMQPTTLSSLDGFISWERTDG